VDLAVEIEFAGYEEEEYPAGLRDRRVLRRAVRVQVVANSRVESEAGQMRSAVGLSARDLGRIASAVGLAAVAVRALGWM
jgi:hypothetical protein